MRTLATVALGVVVHALAACQSGELLSPQQGAILVNQTRLGMSRGELIGQLGEPGKKEAYGDTEFLFYTTNWMMADAALKRNPIAIVGDRVVGLGKAYYEAFLQAQSGWSGEVSSGQPAWQTTVDPGAWATTQTERAQANQLSAPSP
jgi:hypothetical protein